MRQDGDSERRCRSRNGARPAYYEYSYEGRKCRGLLLVTSASTSHQRTDDEELVSTKSRHRAL